MPIIMKKSHPLPYNLVPKLVKCDNCYGVGIVQETIFFGNGFSDVKYNNCQKCEGKGEILSSEIGH